MPAISHKTSVFLHSDTAVAVFSVLAMVTFAAMAACFSGSAGPGISVEEGGTNSAGINSVADEAITGPAAEEEAVGTAAGVEGGTGDAGAAAVVAACQFAARTLLRCLSLGLR